MFYILQTLIGVIEQKYKSGSNLILDCDFEDGYATDKTDNYSFYDNSYVYDVNNNSWFSISDEMEFNDYHYDCNPDFSVPVLEQGSSGSSDSLINPYQVWILAEGWDNLWVEKDSSDVEKLNKIGEYFIYSIADVRYSYEYFNSFFESNDLQEKTKSTLELTSDKNPQSYYGKIIKITENSSTIEVIGDINA